VSILLAVKKMTNLRTNKGTFLFRKEEESKIIEILKILNQKK